VGEGGEQHINIFEIQQHSLAKCFRFVTFFFLRFYGLFSHFGRVFVIGIGYDRVDDFSLARASNFLYVREGEGGEKCTRTKGE